MRKSRFTEEQIIRVLKEHAAGLVGRRAVPEARDQRCDVLQVAVALWRDGGLRRPQAEGAGRGEPQAEEAFGGDDAGRVDAEGDARKKLLTPSLRRRAVTWAIKEKGYSQRRACGLVGLQPKTYRYASKRSGRWRLRKRLQGIGFATPAVRLPASAACCWRGKGSAQSEEAVSALQGGAADRAQAWWPQAGTGHPGADGHPAGS